MDKLTIAEAKRLNDTMVMEEHLKLHGAGEARYPRGRLQGCKVP